MAASGGQSEQYVKTSHIRRFVSECSYLTSVKMLITCCRVEEIVHYLLQFIILIDYIINYYYNRTHGTTHIQ